VLRAEAHKHDAGAFRACLANEPPIRLGASGCRLGAGQGNPQVLLWGDSYAAALAPGIDEQAKAAHTPAQYIGTDSCPPLLGYPGLFRSAAQRCSRIQDAMPKLLTDARPQTLVLFATWRYYYEHAPGQFEQTVQTSFGQYAGLARHVVVVGAIPPARIDVPGALARKLAFGLRGQPEASAQDISATRAANAIVREAAIRQGFTYIDLMASFCDDRCQLVRDGIPIYFDNNHITSTVARTLASLHRDALLGTSDATMQASR
jgi:hypothetical protein